MLLICLYIFFCSIFYIYSCIVEFNFEYMESIFKRCCLLILVFTTINIVSFGQTSKDAIDYLRTHLTYPKYNIGDTIYVWYQTDVNQSVDYQPGIVIRKCIIVDIALVNGGVYNHNDTFSLLFSKENKDPDMNSLYDVSFNYQLLPCDVENRMGNILQNLRSEESLFKTYNECLIDSKRKR